MKTLKDKQEALIQVIALVNKVGDYQLENFRTIKIGGGELKEGKEFVSQIDIHSEELLIAGLEQILPEAGFLGEESGRKGSQENFWIIDPIDGTTNYLSGLDHFSISIALMEKGKLVLGVVYKPTSREVFSAIKGQGTFYNGTKVKTLPKLSMSQALIGSGFPYRSKDLRQQFFNTCDEVLDACRGVRRYGSAALDLAYVATGVFQGFWESDLEPYDVAAGLLLVSEAGATYQTLEKKSYNLFSDRLLIVGWQGIIEPLATIVNRHY